MGQLTEQLGPSVYLDTNIIIYAVEGRYEDRDAVGSLARLDDRMKLLRQHYRRPPESASAPLA